MKRRTLSTAAAVFLLLTTAVVTAGPAQAMQAEILDGTGQEIDSSSATGGGGTHQVCKDLQAQIRALLMQRDAQAEAWAEHSGDTIGLGFANLYNIGALLKLLHHWELWNCSERLGLSGSSTPGGGGAITLGN